MSFVYFRRVVWCCLYILNNMAVGVVWEACALWNMIAVSWMALQYVSFALRSSDVASTFAQAMMCAFSVCWKVVISLSNLTLTSMSSGEVLMHFSV